MRTTGTGRRACVVGLMVLLSALSVGANSAPKARKLDHRRPRFPTAALKARARGAAAVKGLGGKLPEIAAWYGMRGKRLRKMLLRDHALWVDKDGRLHYVCEIKPPKKNAPQPSDGATGDPLPSGSGEPVDNVFALHSRPGASKTIHLDFDGHTTSGTVWDGAYNMGNPIVSQAYDQDGDPSSFNAAEQQAIQEMWARVAEDYAPLDVNVTTEDPGAEALAKSSSSDENYGVRVVISPSSAWIGMGVGGIAYVGSIAWSSDTPCYVFPDRLGNNTKYIAEAAAHEAGHTAGLNHDGHNDGSEYYEGHGDWAPIMGLSYYKTVTQWSRGEYDGANNTEDDLAVMQSHGLLPCTDDHADDVSGATSLDGPSLSANGVVTDQTDVDVFAFTTAAGLIELSVQPCWVGGNLNIRADLYDSDGTFVAAGDPAGLAAAIQADVPAGTYSLHVTGVGTGDPTTGYSEYGSIGQYQVSGVIVDPGTLQQPVAVVSGTPSSGVAPLTVLFSGTASYDPDGTVIGYAWDFGDGAASTEAAPSHTYTDAGNYTATLSVMDNDGLGAHDTVQITVDAPPNTPPVAQASATPGSGYGPLTVQFNGSGSYDLDGAVAGYAWSFGDGGTSASADPAYTYYDIGTYVASLTVTDDAGDSDTASVTIVVEQDPAKVLSVADIAMTAVPVAGGHCAEAVVAVRNANGDLMANVTVVGEWSGLVSGSPVATTGPDGCAAFVSDAAGAGGTITFTVTDLAGSSYSYDPALNLESSDSVWVEPPANQPPVAGITATPLSGSAPLPVSLDGSGSYDPDGSLVAYEWELGDGSTALGASVQHTYQSAGTYTARLTVTDDVGDTDSATVTITVTEAAVLHVGNIDMSLFKINRRKYGARAEVLVVDAGGAAVAGATVSGAWSGAAKGSSSATSGSDGIAVLTSGPGKRGAFILTVTGVSKNGWTYNPAANVETSDSIRR